MHDYVDSGGAPQAAGNAAPQEPNSRLRIGGGNLLLLLFLLWIMGVPISYLWIMLMLTSYFGIV